MGIIVKWTRSVARPRCPDEYVDEIDSDNIPNLRAGRIGTRNWLRDEEGRLRCVTFWADLKIDRGNPTTIGLIYREEGNEELVREGGIVLGTSTFTIADGQRSGTLEWDAADQEPFVVEWYDSRKYHISHTRPEQWAFREGVKELYNSKCAITGCTTEVVLEAAHVISVSEGGGYALDNGILLRSDIHSLFDQNLMAIDPECLEVNIANQIANDYSQYAEFVVNLPDGGPNACDFGHRWEQFLAERRV